MALPFVIAKREADSGRRSHADRKATNVEVDRIGLRMGAHVCRRDMHGPHVARDIRESRDFEIRRKKRGERDQARYAPCKLYNLYNRIYLN